MRILYVEDHADTASVTRMLLERQGHSVTIGRNGREARSLCVDHVFDLWMLDLQLPDEHGGSLLESLRRIGDAPAIALTGCGMPNEVADGLDDGFDEYLVKAFEFDQLFAAIGRHAPIAPDTPGR